MYPQDRTGSPGAALMCTEMIYSRAGITDSWGKEGLLHIVLGGKAKLNPFSHHTQNSIPVFPKAKYRRPKFKKYIYKTLFLR